MNYTRGKFILKLNPQLFLEVEPSTDVYIDGVAAEDSQQNPNLPYLWFGPRLGRRKRTSEEKNPLEESVISVFEDTPWALVPLKGKCT